MSAIVKLKIEYRKILQKNRIQTTVRGTSGQATVQFHFRQMPYWVEFENLFFDICTRVHFLNQFRGDLISNRL